MYVGANGITISQPPTQKLSGPFTPRKSSSELITEPGTHSSVPPAVST
jgi:hypothetical protein